ncbi:MAG: hypothetical protein APF84_16870 [Gracilibacter sp. BRH_c7a]|nr:MAG: hypothetical protein APF84_16870 [Gracilibacter sp. BRH_c7a]
MKGIITVVGKDQVGIIHGVSKVLVDYNVSVEDINQTILKGYFTMMMLVNLANMKGEFNTFKQQLENFGEEIGISVKVQREEIFNYMHNI